MNIRLWTFPFLIYSKIYILDYIFFNLRSKWLNSIYRCETEPWRRKCGIYERIHSNQLPEAKRLWLAFRGGRWWPWRQQTTFVSNIALRFLAQLCPSNQFLLLVQGQCLRNSEERGKWKEKLTNNSVFIDI